jgi:hypothetical protein
MFIQKKLKSSSSSDAGREARRHRVSRCMERPIPGPGEKKRELRQQQSRNATQTTDYSSRAGGLFLSHWSVHTY